MTKLLDRSGDAFHAVGFPLVEIDRRPHDPHLLRGFVLQATARFTLLHVVEDKTFVLDGDAVFPNHTVRRWRCVGPQQFLGRAARHKRLRPKMPEGLRMESWPEIFASVGSKFPLLTIHQEEIEKNVCWIGRLLKVTQRAVTIYEIRPDTSWYGPVTYKFRDITRVQFGGVYESLLDTLAQPFPEAKRRVRPRR